MSDEGEVYLGTVCLERTRWGRRVPSYQVSDWLPRLAMDGFDGVELWENHFVAADAEEQSRLAGASDAIAVFNTYAGFGDGDAIARDRAAQAVERLSARGVKYNLGGDPQRLDEYRRNLLAWADRLPGGCRLLCECHSGSVLEDVEAARSFFSGLDPERFGTIVHLVDDAGSMDRWFAALGRRVRHLHLQWRGATTDPRDAANHARLDACFDVLARHGYRGGATIEFTRGIGPDEQIEALYANACADLAYCRERLRTS